MINSLKNISKKNAKLIIAGVSLVIITLLSLFVFPATDNSTKENEDFSFVVFGDSRIPAYIPYDKNHKEELDRIVQIIGDEIHPDHENFDYNAVYDPHTGLLKRLEIPGRTVIYGEDGWPDIFMDGYGENTRISLRSTGLEWVYNNVVQELQNGAANPNGPTFCLHTGDMVYFGYQGKSAENSPYWRDMNQRFLSRLPRGGLGHLSARFFPSVGNHELWGDNHALGFRQSFPYLKKYGFEKNHRVYHFDYKNSRFIFLDTGTMDPENPEDWYNSEPGYEEQMQLLRGWIEEAIDEDQEHVFVTFHNPVFTRFGYGPLPSEHNPHGLLENYSNRIDINVFNGHIHATEAYNVDNVRYFVVGGGGGEQGLHPRENISDNYPEDYYWQGNAPQLDYNYFVVEVTGGEVQIDVKSFRPNKFQPFNQKNLVPDRMD